MPSGGRASCASPAGSRAGNASVAREPPRIFAEISGKHAIPLGKTQFLLTARADRIERRADGSYAILDYKTGQPPTEPQVRSGLAPQLTLEAAILRQGGFPDIASRLGVRNRLRATERRRTARRTEEHQDSPMARPTVTPTWRCRG